MSRIYRFSPIENENTLYDVYEYIAVELEKLSLELFKERLPITTLKVFAHYPNEYELLLKIVKKMGRSAHFNSKTSYYSEVEKTINGYEIAYLGVRVIDPYRLHVGCGDYEINNFDRFKKQRIEKSGFIRDFLGAENMLETWHPDFDVLGYVIPKEE